MVQGNRWEWISVDGGIGLDDGWGEVFECRESDLKPIVAAGLQRLSAADRLTVLVAQPEVAGLLDLAESMLARLNVHAMSVGPWTPADVAAAWPDEHAALAPFRAAKEATRDG